MVHRNYSPQDLKDLLCGVVVIMVTAYDDEMAVSAQRQSNHINFLIGGGLNEGKGVIVTTGSMGECSCLSWQERKLVLDATLEAAAGRVPVLAGCNGTNIREIIDMAQYAERKGAAGIMLMSPYYWAPDNQAVLDFFKEVARNINIGIMLYNNLPIVRKDLSISLISELSRIENIAGIKECTPNFFKFIDLIQAINDRLTVVNGNGEFWEPFAGLAGAKGFSSGFVNFAPQVTMKMWKLRKKGDYKKAVELRMKIAPVLKFWSTMVEKYGPSIEASVIKTAAVFAGSPLGDARLPASRVNEEERAELKNLIGELEKV